MDTPILALLQRARDAGVPVRVAPPAAMIPDTQALLNVPIDPQLVAFLGATDECMVGDGSSCFGNIDTADLVKDNLSMRGCFEYLPLLHQVLVWGRYTRYLMDLISIPALADAQGRQPVAILDANDAPLIDPLASTFDRALALIIEDLILSAQDVDDMREVFPYCMAAEVAEDVRLMQLIDQGAFELGGGAELEGEWMDMLRQARADARR